MRPAADSSTKVRWYNRPGAVMRIPLAFARRRIGIPLGAGLLVLSLAPLLGAAPFILDLLERSLTRQAHESQQRTLAAAAALVEDYIENGRAKLRTIGSILDEEDLVRPAAVPQEDERKIDDLARRLNDRLDPVDVFLEIHYFAKERKAGKNYSQRASAVAQTRAGVDPSGRTDPLQNLLTPSNDFVNRSFSRNENVSEGIQMYADRIPALFLSVSVTQMEETAGLLFAALDLRPLEEILADLAGADASLVARDPQGVTIGPSRPSFEDRLEASRRLATPPWELTISQPRAGLLSVVTEARRHVLLWLGAAAVVALGLTMFLTRRITSPVRALSRAAERLAAGDRMARTGIERDDELGQLARSFDRMAEALQKLDQMKSDFIAHVSHELRTPLTAMRLSLANLQDGVAGPLTPKQLDVAARLRQDMERLIRMVNELLDVARLEAGEELAQDRVDLAAVVRDAVAMLEPLARERKVGIAFSTDGEAVVRGDRAKLIRVATNLLDNAVKFSPPDGTVEIVVRSDGESVRLVVEDRGPGIDPARIGQVFDRFSNLVPPSGVKPPGAGLGLHLARKIVELHGGSIRAENREGGGARFVVTLARSPKPQ